MRPLNFEINVGKPQIKDSQTDEFINKLIGEHLKPLFDKKK